MIAAAEIHRRAREWNVDPMIVELDYVLGCFLSRWFRHLVPEKMLFKGGTCLRKCYFPDYRFSEDIDITAEKPVDAGQVREAIEAVALDLDQTVGVDLRAQPLRIETIEAGESTSYIEARIYFRGPLQRTGWPQGIRIDISTGESLAFPAVERSLDHPYSDRQSVVSTGLSLRCYDLREVLLEKLRGLAGQRRYAIARDLYDVYWLVERAGINVTEVAPHAPAKFAAKGVALSPRTLDALLERKDEFQNDWSRNVDGLMPGEKRIAFSWGWATTLRAFSTVVAGG